jgi:hypothetical protein
MRYTHILADKDAAFTEQLGINVEGAFESVLIKQLNESYILRDTVIVAEGYCLFLAVEIKHNFCLSQSM